MMMQDRTKVIIYEGLIRSHIRILIGIIVNDLG